MKTIGILGGDELGIHRRILPPPQRRGEGPARRAPFRPLPRVLRRFRGRGKTPERRRLDRGGPFPGRGRSQAGTRRRRLPSSSPRTPCTNPRRPWKPPSASPSSTSPTPLPTRSRPRACPGSASSAPGSPWKKVSTPAASKHGTALEVLVPDAADRAAVNRVIYEELVLGKILASSRETNRRGHRRPRGKGRRRHRPRLHGDRPPRQGRGFLRPRLRHHEDPRRGRGRVKFTK